MARMTDEEASRLDEKWTKNPPKPGPNGTGYFTRCKAASVATALLDQAAHSIMVDGFTANYLSSKAIADHKTPAEIISEMVQERIVASM
jgi:hypothetical protein